MAQTRTARVIADLVLDRASATAAHTMRATRPATSVRAMRLRSSMVTRPLLVRNGPRYSKTATTPVTGYLRPRRATIPIKYTNPVLERGFHRQVLASSR